MNPNNDGKSFFLNHWQLEWIEHPASKGRYYLDHYSIHQKDILKVLDRLAKVNLPEYFELVKQTADLSQEDNHRHQQIISEWIKMYEVAIAKNKGIVYDVG